MTPEPRQPVLNIQAAAELLELPQTSVEALVAGGYLGLARHGKGTGPATFHLSDLKAFIARNADNGAGAGLLYQALGDPEDGMGRSPGLGAAASLRPPDLEPDELLELLDERAEHMAHRLFKIYATVFPDAGKWTGAKQAAFVARTKSRFEAILAVSALGSEVDRSLFDELRRIGHAAALTGTPLPELLILLRMSRDLVVQNAVELAGGGGRHGGFALSLLLTRILPAMDHLGDALAHGYWAAISSST
jgi:hypothetical protein